MNGLQVAPAELENTLRQLDGVEDVAVVGVQDERAGQLPRAFIVRCRWREMKRDGERWRVMERDGKRWREMKRDEERWREKKRDGER